MKKRRLAAIIEIIESQNIETQEELAAHLRAAGFDVTQATVSRDIRELQLSKVSDGKGRQRYAVLGKDDGYMGDRYIRVLREGFASVDAAQNLVVIKTVAGMAMAVAAALDAMRFAEVLGCIAGDDTIMVACHTTKDAVELTHKIKEMLDK